MYFQGGEPVFTPDAALDLKSFPDNVLALYSAYRSSVQFHARRRVSASSARTPAVAGRAAPCGDAVDPRDIGSNNWVIAGSRTQSTFPILANDPHRVIGAPSLRYWVHLVAPGWDVIGGGEPVLPGVSIGHNAHGAWGLTIFGNDSEDLYVYETNPANANEYRYQGRWEAMRVAADSIPVKGEKPRAVELKFTRHGPVLFEDRTKHRAYAIRAAWLEVGGAPYLASLRMDQATTWEEFREACRFSHMPAENMIWADRSGHDRLAGGRDPAAAQELERPAAGSRRWTLRVERLPADRIAAVGDESRARLHRHRQQLPVPRRRRESGRRCTTTGPIRIARRASPNCSDRGASSALPRSPACRTTISPFRRARSCRCCSDLSLPSGPAAKARELLHRLGLRARQGLGGRRHLRDVAAAPLRERARAPDRAAGAPRARRQRSSPPSA